MAFLQGEKRSRKEFVHFLIKKNDIYLKEILLYTGRSLLGTPFIQ